MKWRVAGALLAAALLVACGRPKGRHNVEPIPSRPNPPSTDAPRPASSPPFQKPTALEPKCRLEAELPAAFAKIEGWGPLRWGMDVDEAEAALAKAGIPYERKEFHKSAEDYFKIEVCGWEGTVYMRHYETADKKWPQKITQILFQSPELATEAEASATVADTQKVFGPPQATPTGYHDENRNDKMYVWSADNAKLDVTVAQYAWPDKPVYWIVWKNLQPGRK
jgi:hypothetical protein